MNDHIIDCCSLLNLYTGWGGLVELQGLGRTWHVCAAVVAEAEYTREYDQNGQPQIVALDIQAFTQSGQLLPSRPETTQELDDYVEFAIEVDDGEAQALAIAKNRGYVLLTDDHRAANLAAGVGVQTISSAEILRAWAQLNARNEARLPSVVKRIDELARFCPRKDSPDFTWWREYLQRPA